MKINFAGIDLSDWDEFPAQGVSVNGELVFEAVQIVRAASKKFYDRGNESLSLSFSVRREFATHAECQVYLLTHFSTLTKVGLCTITCGVPGEDEQLVYVANAILYASPQGSFNGVESVVQYQVVGPVATTELPPDFLLGGEPMILRNRQAITAAAESVAVVFGAPFAAAPIVTVSVTKPAGGENLWATVQEASVTVNGFTADLSALAPAAGYKLNWFAITA